MAGIADFKDDDKKVHRFELIVGTFSKLENVTHWAEMSIPPKEYM